MTIVNIHIHRRFAQQHANSRAALNRWERVVAATIYADENDLKSYFGKRVSIVGSQTVFRVGYGDRIIARLDYGDRIVDIEYVLTHDEYMQNQWRA